MSSPVRHRVSPYGNIRVTMEDVSNRQASDLSKRVAAELRAAQARHRFSWGDVEKATGITHVTMWRMLQGQTDISVAKLMLICEATGLSVTGILEDAMRHAPYKLHDLLTDHSVSPTVSDGPATVTNTQQHDWNTYTGKKAADIDDEVQTDAEA